MRQYDADMRVRLLGLGAVVTVGVVLLLAVVRSSPLLVVNDASTLWVVPVVLGALSTWLVAQRRLPVFAVVPPIVMGGLSAIAGLLIIRGTFFPFSVMIQAGFLVVAALLGAFLGLALRRRAALQ